MEAGLESDLEKTLVLSSDGNSIKDESKNNRKKNKRKKKKQTQDGGDGMGISVEEFQEIRSRVGEFIRNDVDLKMNQSHGRFLFAQNSMKPGTLVLSSDSYCYVIDDSVAGSLCHRCFGNLVQDYLCGGCRFTRFCSVQCHKEWMALHEFECSFLKIIMDNSGGEDTKAIRLLLRILSQNYIQTEETKKLESFRQNLKKKSTEHKRKGLDYSDFLRLVHNKESQDETKLDAVTQFVQDVKASLEDLPFFTNLWPEKDDEVVENLLRIQANAHMITRPDDKARLGLGIFPIACYVNHSCAPNCHISYSFDRSKGFQILFHATTTIEKGQELNYDYIDIYQHSSSRRENLRAVYSFDCDCSRCIQKFGDEIIEGLQCASCLGNGVIQNLVCSTCFTPIFKDELHRNAVQKEFVSILSEIQNLVATNSQLALSRLISLSTSDDFLRFHPQSRLSFTLYSVGINCSRSAGNFPVLESFCSKALQCLLGSHLGFDSSNRPEVADVYLSLAEAFQAQNKSIQAKDALTSALNIRKLSLGCNSWVSVPDLILKESIDSSDPKNREKSKRKKKK